MSTELLNCDETKQLQDFREKYFPEATQEDWNNWHWQLANRFRNINDVTKVLNLSSQEYNALSSSTNALPISVTPYYMSLIDSNNNEQAIRKAVIPVCAETVMSDGESKDPLNEDSCSPVPGIVHRYPDRVLFLVTDFCSVYCRYCTRSRMVGHSENYNSVRQWEKAIEYIENNKQIRDVLISGGDPLTLPDEMLEWLLTKLRKIPHVEILRIGTKAPVVLPQRITQNLVDMLKKYHPLMMSIHFTHPDELTPETQKACNMLADAGIPLGSQTVLLKGINDNVETMTKLYHELLKVRVKPYYLYQCDPIPGSSHFRTSVKKGLDIIHGLRGFTSGYAIPHYVIDAPGGGGKTPLLPEYYIGKDGNDILLKSYDGNVYRYPDTIKD